MELRPPFNSFRIARLIIHIALHLLLLAFGLFVLMKLIAGLSVPYLSERLAWFGLVAMFCAFALIAVAGILAACLAVILPLTRFFSAPQRAQRRVLRIQSYQRRQSELLPLKIAQIRYFHDLKKRKLQRLDHRLHTRALSLAIAKDLSSARKCLPNSTVKALQRENRRNRNRQDDTALVELQEKIALLTQTCRE